MADILTSLISAAATGAEQSNIVSTNKNRVGVVVHDGYAIKDFFDANRMAFFVVGLLGLAASGYGITVRKTGEARVLYAMAALASLGIAWTFRPGAGPSASGAQAAGAAAAADQSAYSKSAVLTYLDDRAAVLGAQDPNFATEALTRLLNDAGGGNISALTALVS